MNKSFKYIFASALLVASFMSDAVAQRKVTAEQSEAEKAEKSVMLTKKTTPVEGVDGAYYLDLETFITGYTSNVTTYSTVTVSTPLDIVLLLDVSGSMSWNMAGTQKSNVATTDQRIYALKQAVNNFIATIKSDSETNNVEHRISLIKFAGPEYPDGTNTSSKTVYYARTNTAYSYQVYGNNAYYYKDGDNYYQVSRETGEGSVSYTARNSSNYTYDGYGNNTYYYKDGDNYYPVSRGSYSTGSGWNKKTYYYLSYTANNTTHYLSGTGETTTRPSNVTDNKGTIWTGVLYTRSATTVYRLYYTNGTKHYLSGSTETTTAPIDVTAAATTIWTGILYSKETVTTPDNIVEGNGKYNNNTYNYTQVVKNFLSVKDNKDALNTAVNNLSTGGATAADYGVMLANTVFTSGGRADALKVLVLFTDGDPTHGSSFDATVANSTIAGTKPLKESGVKVYVVGTISGVTDGSNTDKYLKYASSNYIHATSLTDAGDMTTGGNYSFNTTDAYELNNVFQKISEEASQDAANANAGYTEATVANNVTIKDIVTENFVIPSNADGEINLGNIQIWTAKSTGVTRADNFNYQDYQYSAYTWDDPVLRTDLEPEAHRSDDKKTSVSVPGFDFSENWVGWQDAYETRDGAKPTRKEDECFLHEGYKLILRILVEPDPDAVGGLVPTNDPASGLYITKDGTEISLKSYEVPPSVLVPMDLTIVMNGITDRGNKNLYKEGETAIFQVEGYGGKGWTVAVTADANGHGEASIKVPFYNSAEKDQFTVTEISGWSYRFNSVVDIEKETGTTEATASRTKQLTADDHIFYFKATDTEDLGSDGMVSRDFQVYFYHENNKNNVFNRATEN